MAKSNSLSWLPGFKLDPYPFGAGLVLLWLLAQLDDFESNEIVPVFQPRVE